MELALVAGMLALSACHDDVTPSDTDADTDTDTDGTGTSLDDTGMDTTGGPETDLPPEGMFEILSVEATPATVAEGELGEVTLRVTYSLPPDEQTWRQNRGPRTPGPSPSGGGPGDTVHTSTIDLSSFHIAADTELEFEIEATLDGVTDVETVVVGALASDLEPALGEGVQIGGASTSTALLDVGGEPWALYNIGNQLLATPVALSQDPQGLHLSSYIRDIELVPVLGYTYALVALGTGGIAVVDVTDPNAMVVVSDGVRVNFYEPTVIFAEGGGSILTEELSGSSGDITSLATDGVTLWIGNADYGIHRTALDNLVAGPVLEADGTLLVESEAYLLQYAGEHPWGGPSDLQLVDGRLFVAMGQLGLGIYDPTTLERVGYYNLYTDVGMSEDWFVGMDVATQVHDDGTGPFLDPDTGMPDYRQASFEIVEVWKNEVEAPTPWAELDRYGKFYYDARKVAVAEQGGRTIAYIAYALGGLVAVDVTGHQGADAGANFLHGTYLGYAPAIPAHGPEEPSGSQSRSLYPYYGAGMLKESGVVDVAVDGTDVYYTDHFAGLVVLAGGHQPETQWRGAGAPFDNDDPSLGDGVLGDHWPDWEFVTSYDMSLFDPDDHDSLPIWMQSAPTMLVTGEVSGHGNRLVLTPGLATALPGNVDVVQCAGAGGLDFIDIHDFSALAMEDRFELLTHFPTTDEIGAAPDGSPTEEISIGHTQGIAATDGYLYVGDGPHGVSAWALRDEEGNQVDDIRLVANSIQLEDPVEVDGQTIYPPHHAWGTVYDPQRQVVWSMSQSLGMRRVDVSAVEAGGGAPGAPLLLRLGAKDLFEHNGIFGVSEVVSGQDHAYDVEMLGDLAFVADGSNGLTVYDVTQDPTDVDGGYVVANIGGEKQQKPPLGRTVAIDLWSPPSDESARYAFMAAGQRGVAVLDVSDLEDLRFIKVFEPIKIEDDNVIHADSRAVDVHVVGDHVVYSYSGFGVLVYTIESLIEPVPEGVDPTEIWHSGNMGGTAFDYRPETVSEFRLHEQPGFEETDAEALYMEHSEVDGRLVFYIAYGHAGVARLDLSDPTTPVLLEVADTVGEAISVAVSNGRLFVADHEGGIAPFR
ncbi:MAG: hypothetical protein H6712_26985 [Myxococcales bacterium]|nr:hypothetical protein [Myxococcales bacterium]